MEVLIERYQRFERQSFSMSSEWATRRCGRCQRRWQESSKEAAYIEYWWCCSPRIRPASTCQYQLHMHQFLNLPFPELQSYRPTVAVSDHPSRVSHWLSCDRTATYPKASSRRPSWDQSQGDKDSGKNQQHERGAEDLPIAVDPERRIFCRCWKRRMRHFPRQIYEMKCLAWAIGNEKFTAKTWRTKSESAQVRRDRWDWSESGNFTSFVNLD